jgi:hypothetical protein
VTRPPWTPKTARERSSVVLNPDTAVVFRDHRQRQIVERL